MMSAHPVLTDRSAYLIHLIHAGLARVFVIVFNHKLLQLLPTDVAVDLSLKTFNGYSY